MSTGIGRSEPTARTTSRSTMPSLLRKILLRRELSALVAAIAIFILFWAIAEPFRSWAAMATVLYQSATIGLMAVAVALLMIGGEFDLSSGVAVVTASMVTSVLTVTLGLPLFVSMALALSVSIGIGIFNGWLVTRTGIPSFLITLSALFMLFGMNLGITKFVTNAVSTPSVARVDGFEVIRAIFAYRLQFGGEGGPQFSILILWWFVFVAIATWVLLRTRIGNWILASGGNAASARAVGVPTKRVKIGLFAFVGFSAWFYAMHQLSAYNTVQAGSGVGGEFLYIIAAVVGGCALTGGVGSAIGSAIGALIYGMTVQGIVYAGWDPNWFRFFLGLMLLLAVLLNLNVRRMSEKA
ncbi:MAG: ABC transporter permease [Chloroflexota bacterium]|nr:MAG: ABC transporter permease [Chloroflexota bacterium]